MGLKVHTALKVVGMPRSTYYFQGTGKKRGRRCSSTTLFKGEVVNNADVVDRIREILEPDFIDYGYKRCTVVLKDEGYQIGKQKVYRLMKEHGLLHLKIKGKKGSKKYVVFTSPRPERPFQVLETDIKYVYISGERRNAYLITILDTFHRQALVWGLFADMKTDKVLGLILQLIDEFLIPNGIDPKEVDVVIRSDNGSQFIAEMYKKLLQDCHIQSNYIPPASPQMNGHIEAFHSTVQRLVCSKYVFESLEQARQIFSSFFHTYNNLRIMKSILYKTPTQFFTLWKQGHIGIYKREGKNYFYFKEEGVTDTPPPSEAFDSVNANLCAL